MEKMRVMTIKHLAAAALSTLLSVVSAAPALAAHAAAAHAASLTNQEVLGKWCRERVDGAVEYYDRFCDDGDASQYLLFGRAGLTGPDLDCRYVSVKGRGDYPRPSRSADGFVRPVHGWVAPVVINARCVEAARPVREVRFTLSMSRGQLVVQRAG
jgi:hypothetical protein